MASCALTSKALKDIEDCIAQLKILFSEEKIPINDDCTILHRFEEKVEIILQLGLKEKPGVFGVKRSYWDYICTCFTSSKRPHEGIKFVKSSSELKTSLGRGRALIRFCLTQKCLADTLHSCFIDLKTTRDFFSDRCFLLQPKLWSPFITFLYDLNEINFDLNPQNSELDVSWPSFARKIFHSPAHQVLPLTNMNSSNSNNFSVQRNNDELCDNVLPEREDNKTSKETQHLLAVNSELEADVLSLQKKCETLEQEICCAHMQHAFGMISENMEMESSNVSVKDDCKVMSDKTDGMDSELNFHSELDAPRSCNLKVQSFCENFSEGIENNSNVRNSHSNTSYDLISPELVSAINEYDSSTLNSIHFSSSGLPEKIVCLLQTETMPFHPEITESIKRLILEMKIILDNLGNNMNTGAEELTVQSNLTRLKSIRDYFEQILFMELKKLNDCKMINHNCEEYANCMKSLVLNQENVIHSLVERINLSVKGNENLYDQLCFLKDKLHSFGLLKVQTEALIDSQNKSHIIDKSCKNVDNFSENHVNFDFQLCSNMSNDCLESFEILKNSSMKLNVLNMQTKNLQLLVESSHKLNDNLISRVQDQEMHMKGITKQLEEAHQLLSTMRQQHQKLQSAESIVKYDLQEKRKLLNKLKQQLEATREDCNLVRLKNSKSEVEWQNLRKDFRRRNKQTSEESGFIDDKGIEDQNSVVVSDVCECSLSDNVPDSDVSFDNNSIDSKYELKKNRLQLLEEQCQILCTNLKNSSKKRKEIDYRLESWCKAIENSHKVTPQSDKSIEVLNSDSENKDNDLTSNDKMSIDSGSDIDSSLSSSEIGSFNSDCCSYIPHNSTVVSTDINSSLQSVKIDELNSEWNQDKSFDDEHQNSMDSEPISKGSFSNDHLKNLDNVQDTVCNSIKSFEETEQCQVEDSVLFNSKEKSLEMNHQEMCLPEKKSSETGFKELSKLLTEVKEEKKILQLRCNELELQNSVLSEKLHWVTQELQLTAEAKEREVVALQFQLNSEVLKYERAIKDYSENTEGLKDMKQKVNDQEQLILTLEEALAEIQVERESEKEHQWEQLQDIQIALASREEECSSLSSSIEQLEDFKKTSLKDKEILECEIIHLRNDAKELQKKIIKLLKEKDILWKMNDRLRYLHKIQIDDRWVNDHEVTECLGCRSNFSFLLRKHHCRQCGRIFCHACSNNWLLTPASRRQIRVCNECYMQHIEIKTDVRRDSNVQYYDESEDEAVDDLSLNLNRKIHPSIADSMVSLPVMQVTDFKQKSRFTSAPELHFTRENLEAPNERSSKDLGLSSHVEVVENDISGNLLIKAKEEAILPILNEVNSTSIAWSFEPPCEAIPISMIYEDTGHCNVQQTVLHQSSCETGVIHLSHPGLYKFHFDNKLRSSSMLVRYSFKVNILKEQEISC
ncbi:FYVE and coiled-coil domain-containing protein 1 [Trichonephila inaurata madagascariensis]|uniref:FYVE and coiled-coil domain-containing protein 1 n=1 Tax=Trichonephila inaurata madagascariensis TaxID=2747483 RepID=A0A8X6IPN6_9ARAC|nr:FYVE and coiled-coil domain-containing protein 1 [Trichonephila inaurata madagascariensis]